MPITTLAVSSTSATDARAAREIPVRARSERRSDGELTAPAAPDQLSTAGPDRRRQIVAFGRPARDMADGAVGADEPARQPERLEPRRRLLAADDRGGAGDVRVQAASRRTTLTVRHTLSADRPVSGSIRWCAGPESVSPAADRGARGRQAAGARARSTGRARRSRSGGRRSPGPATAGRRGPGDREVAAERHEHAAAGGRASPARRRGRRRAPWRSRRGRD